MKDMSHGAKQNDIREYRMYCIDQTTQVSGLRGTCFVLKSSSLVRQRHFLQQRYRVSFRLFVCRQPRFLQSALQICDFQKCSLVGSVVFWWCRHKRAMNMSMMMNMMMVKSFFLFGSVFLLLLCDENTEEKTKQKNTRKKSQKRLLLHRVCKRIYTGETSKDHHHEHDDDDDHTKKMRARPLFV